MLSKHRKPARRRFEFRSPSKFFAKVLFSLITVLLLGTIVFYFLFQTANQPLVQNHLEQYSLTRLTGSGSANYAAISPDGRLVVYSLEPRIGEEGLFLRSVESGEENVLIPPSALEFSGLPFRRTGNIFFMPSNRLTALSPLYIACRLPAARRRKF